MTAFRLELRRNRTLTIWLAVSMAVYGAIIAAMYPVMVENDALFTAYMETFPQEFLAAFGMTGSLSDPGIFYTTYISSWLWPIMAAVWHCCWGRAWLRTSIAGSWTCRWRRPCRGSDTSPPRSSARRSRWPCWRSRPSVACG